jgi:1,4-dihydroxy-2-naphthoate octaprenyltransferase
MTATYTTQNLLKAYLEALRPKVLMVSAIPVLIGTALSGVPYSEIRYGLCFSVFFTALFIQIGTNLVNDAFDFIRGADTSGRLGPERLIQKGIATPKATLLAGWAFFMMAALAALPLVFAGGWFFALIVALSIFLGWAYTAGPYPLAYTGLSELFIITFFGLVLTQSATYFQTEEFSLSAALAGLQIGIFSVLPLAINNLRDIEEDRKAGKMTLVVRFGERFGQYEIAASIVIPFLLNIFWLEKGVVPFLFPLFTLPMAYNLIVSVFKTRPCRQYNQFFADAGLLYLCFGILLAIGFRLA